MKIFRIALCIAALAVFSAPGWAQAVSTAQISGTVQDASGSAVPGAEIKVTQTATGAVRTVTSGADGSYTLPSLPVGPYSLQVTKPGFSTYVRTGIVLEVASNPAIPVTLAVGAVTEQVQVEANAAMVETQSTGVGQVIDSRRVVDLPLVGRQATDLVVLSGAAVENGTTTSSNRGVYPNISTFSVAGGLGGGNIFALDGAFHNDVYALSALPLPFPDALQEFKVETSSLPAQYGYHSGGAINAVTKSGTNQYHGAAFEFLRNYDLNARNFFSTTPDGLKRNQFGGTFGGPIIKDKLFFFAGYQETDTRQTPSDQIEFVPTAQMLAGNFTTYASSVCQSKPFTLNDPFTGKPLAVKNMIPANEISPVAIAISKKLPAATNACGQTNYGIPVSSDEHFGVGKVDYQMTPSHSMFVRYLGTQFNQASPYQVSQNVLSTGTPGASDLVQSAVFGDTYLFGATVVNSFRADYNRVNTARVPAQFFGASDVGINMFQYSKDYLALSVSGAFSIGGSLGLNSVFHSASGQLGDDVLVTRGAHQMAFGAMLLIYQSNSYGTSFISGNYSITGSATGNAMADFITGQIANINQNAPNRTFPQQWYLGLYAQDAWKVRRNLTFNYGLRWEPAFPAQLRQNINSHFDLNGFLQGVVSKQFVNAPPGLYFPGDAQFGPNGSASINKNWKQFAPRVGIVWDPTGNGNTVIRAGYGIFYDQTSAELYAQIGQGPPFGGKVTVNAPAGGLANPYLNFPGGDPFPFNFSSTTAFPAGGTFQTFNADTKFPYVQQWNLGIQKQLGKDWLASATYLGNEVTHLYGQRELNPSVYIPGTCAKGQYGLTAPGPCSTVANTNNRRMLSLLNPVTAAAYGPVDVWDDGGTRSYNGLLLSIQKRFSKGFLVSGNYTWSHCIGDPINTFPSAATNDLLATTRAGDRGDCTTASSDVGGVGTDHRHIANITALGTMPNFKDRTLRMVASQWKGSLTVSMYSGDALTVVTGNDTALIGFDTATQYASELLPNIYQKQGTQWLNPNAFGAAATGTMGNLAPGSVRGPGAVIVNAGLSRLFPVKERQTLELRAEAQNVLNHTNFGNPSVALNSNFGRITSTASGNAGQARIIQLALKYVF